MTAAGTVSAMSAPGSVAARRRPRPLLSQRAEAQLGARHREVLDELESLFLREGFSGVSVRELAAHVGCSRRTLYEVAPSKDELVLIVLDRFLHRVGRDALDAIDTTESYAEQITAYSWAVSSCNGSPTCSPKTWPTTPPPGVCSTGTTDT